MELDQSHTSIDAKAPLLCLPPTTSLRTAAARAEARTALQKEVVAIEKEVDEVRLRLSSVHTRLNGLSPISLLPPELLSRIFHILRDNWKSLVIFKLLGWVAVTHVCRQWRQVALEDASLWTEIGSPFYFNHNWFLEMLTRSKRAKIDITTPSKPSPETLLTLSHHFSRIRTLSLHNFGETFYNAKQQKFLGSEAPVLEEFVMTPMDPMMAGGYFISAADSLPPGYKLFDGQAPKLRKMQLSCFPIPWKYLPKCTLTHLQVSGGPGLAYCNSDEGLDPLANVLTDTAPTLEMLSLDGCLPPLRSQPTQTRVIEFPRLSQLYLKGSSSCVVHLLQSLKMPPLARLGLHFIANGDEEVASWPTIVPFAISCLDDPKMSAFRTLCLEFAPEIGWTTTAVYASRTADIFDKPRSDDKVDLLLKFENESLSNSGSSNIIQKVCATLNMTRLDRMEVEAPYMRHPPDWVDLFRSCTEVTLLKTSGSGTASLLQAMTLPTYPPHAGAINNAASRPEGTQPQGRSDARSQEAGGAIVKPLLFPNLMSLYFNKHDFGALVCSAGTLFFLVKDLINTRRSFDAEIDEIIITACRIEYTEAYEIEDLVDGFHWDDKEGRSSEEDEDEDDDDDDMSDSDFGSEPGGGLAFW